jgi:transcription termination factor NusA
MPKFITSIPGIGGATAAVLNKHGFRTLEDLASASPDALSAVPGFGAKRATRTIEAARTALTAESGETAPAQDAQGPATEPVAADVAEKNPTKDGNKVKIKIEDKPKVEPKAEQPTEDKKASKGAKAGKGKLAAEKMKPGKDKKAGKAKKKAKKA